MSAFLVRLGFDYLTAGGPDRNRCVIQPIDAETFTQTRRQVQAAGPAWALGPEDRSLFETEIPNHVEIESIEPRCTLGFHFVDLPGISETLSMRFDMVRYIGIDIASAYRTLRRKLLLQGREFRKSGL